MVWQPGICRFAWRISKPDPKSVCPHHYSQKGETTSRHYYHRTTFCNWPIPSGKLNSAPSPSPISFIFFVVFTSINFFKIYNWNVMIYSTKRYCLILKAVLHSTIIFYLLHYMSCMPYMNSTRDQGKVTRAWWSSRREEQNLTYLQSLLQTSCRCLHMTFIQKECLRMIWSKTTIILV